MKTWKLNADGGLDFTARDLNGRTLPGTEARQDEMLIDGWRGNSPFTVGDRVYFEPDYVYEVISWTPGYTLLPGCGQALIRRVVE